MAANSSLNLTSLDFDTLKSNLVTFLKAQKAFKDYDFEGSNMNVLLDVMSYNSFLNSFYLNMVASEMFMDSAQKLDSVVSHAKELNYVPQSNKSSVAFVSFKAATVGINGKFVIPKGTRFSGTNSNGFYTFSTAETFTYLSGNSYFNVANLAIYDGTYTTDTFVVDKTIDTQKFLLSNPNIDVDSLSINVIENNGQSNTTFNRKDTLYELNSQSNVYFLQGAQKNQYEILFGDGILGRSPQNGAIINAEYRIASGSEADGISSFVCDNSLGVINGGTANMSAITTISKSSGGALAEDLESIRFRAPRYFAAQQRAVATDDFSSLVLTKFGGEVSDVTVYGGETLEPKQYGRVVVCLKPSGTTYAPDYLKTEIINYLTPYISLPTRVIITDPDYLYLKIDSTVQYDQTLTNKFHNDIKNLVLSTISNYSKNNLEVFKKDFRYSRFVNQIDTTDVSIISNDTKVLLLKRISPTPNIAVTVNIDYNNSGELEGVYGGQQYPDEPTLYSSVFSFVNTDGTQYKNCYLRDDGLGNIFVYTIINNQKSTINPNIGSVDYITGKIVLNKFNASNYGEYISMFFVPSTKDLYASKNKILIIDPNDVSVNVITKLD